MWKECGREGPSPRSGDEEIVYYRMRHGPEARLAGVRRKRCLSRPYYCARSAEAEVPERLYHRDNFSDVLPQELQSSEV